MPVYTTIAASSSASISLPAGSTLELTGSGTAQVVPPAPVPGDAAARTLGSGDVTFGPYSRACTVNVVAGAVAVRYFVASASSAFPAAAGQAAAGPVDVDQVAQLIANAGIGGATLTRAALVAMADASGLTPGAVYLTTDGLICDALTSRYLQPRGPWFVDGRRWSVGSATSATDLSYTTLPPLGPNAYVEIWHQWYMDAVNVTKRSRLYLDGTLGGGIAGATALWSKLHNNTNTMMMQYTKFQNRNDAASQIAMTADDSAPFNQTPTATVFPAVSTNTSKLLRAMGETSKSGSNVTISTPNLTRVGSEAFAAVTGHGLASGDYIGVAGATQPEYNVDPVAVTVIDANNFKYTITGTPATPATTGSTITYQKYVGMALVSFRVEIRQGL